MPIAVATADVEMQTAPEDPSPRARRSPSCMALIVTPNFRVASRRLRLTEAESVRYGLKLNTGKRTHLAYKLSGKPALPKLRKDQQRLKQPTPAPQSQPR